MIKLSKKGSYGLKSVIFIAKSTSDLVNISEIAKDQDISEGCLRPIIADLNKSGIIITIQGRNGGIKLAKKPNAISTYDILSAVGEELGIRDCTKGGFCAKKDDCTTTDLLSDLQRGFHALLKIKTLDKIIK